MDGLMNGWTDSRPLTLHSHYQVTKHEATIQFLCVYNTIKATVQQNTHLNWDFLKIIYKLVMTTHGWKDFSDQSCLICGKKCCHVNAGNSDKLHIQSAPENHMTLLFWVLFCLCLFERCLLSAISCWIVFVFSYINLVKKLIYCFHQHCPVSKWLKIWGLGFKPQHCQALEQDP